MNDKLTGAEAALCALSFFRHRHGTQPRFKKPKRRRRTTEVKVSRADYVCIARDYIRQARISEFRGSFLDAAKELDRQRGGAALRVLCLLTILGALGFAGAILPSILRQIWANFHAVLECIDALTKC